MKDFMEMHHLALDVRGNEGKAWATNVPCCTLVTGAPLESWRYVPNNMILEILLNQREYEEFPIPQEFVLEGPESLPKADWFQWGRRYSKFGYFLENPSTPGYGNIYKRTPTWEDRPDNAEKGSWKSRWLKDYLPALDLVEWWEDAGSDGHTEYYRRGHAVVPHSLWNAGCSNDPCGFMNYPYSVHGTLNRYPEGEESTRKSVGRLSKFWLEEIEDNGQGAKDE